MTNYELQIIPYSMEPSEEFRQFHTMLIDLDPNPGREAYGGYLNFYQTYTITEEDMVILRIRFPRYIRYVYSQEIV